MRKRGFSQEPEFILLTILTTSSTGQQTSKIKLEHFKTADGQEIATGIRFGVGDWSGTESLVTVSYLKLINCGGTDEASLLLRVALSPCPAVFGDVIAAKQLLVTLKKANGNRPDFPCAKRQQHSQLTSLSLSSSSPV